MRLYRIGKYIGPGPRGYDYVLADDMLQVHEITEKNGISVRDLMGIQLLADTNRTSTMPNLLWREALKEKGE